MKLSDSVAIITGAASGIGRACVQRFLEEGATVLACDIDRAGLAQLAAENAQSRLHTALCDVTKRADAEASVEQALSTQRQARLSRQLGRHYSTHAAAGS